MDFCVPAHAGTLQIESSTTEGTTVTVTLPTHTYTSEVPHAVAQ